MDIEQRVEKLEREVEFLLAEAERTGIREQPELGYTTPGVEWDFSQDNTVESERLKVRHEMAKGVAEIVTNAGITIDDLSKFGGIDKRTWKDLFNCAKAEYDYENLAAARQADDKYRSGISNLATSLKGLFVLREALRCLPMPVFSQEEFNKRKQSDEACEKLLEGHDGKCDGWASSFRTAKLFAQQQGYLGA